MNVDNHCTLTYIPYIIRSHNTSNPNILESQGSPNRMNVTPTHTNNNNNSPAGNPVGVVKGVQQAKTPESDSPVMKDVPPYR